jgi:hypothetical protein
MKAIEKAHLKGELFPESYSNDAYVYYTAKQAALARTACCLNTSRDGLQYYYITMETKKPPSLAAISLENTRFTKH